MTVRAGVAFLLACGFASAQAQVVRQITDLKRTETTEMALSDDGAVGFFCSSATPDGRYQIFRWDAATGTSAQLTQLPGGVDCGGPGLNLRPSVTDDGAVVAFMADRRVALVDGDGANFRQVTSTPTTTLRVQISGSGNRLVFDATENLTGANAAGVEQVFVVEADGTGLHQVSSETASFYRYASISDDGERIAYVTTKDPGVPQPFAQVAGVNHDGTGWHFLTSSSGIYPVPQLSGDGETVVFSNLFGFTGCSSGRPLLLADWAGSGAVLVRCPSLPCTSSGNNGYVEYPDITDDAQTIVYAGGDSGPPSAYWGCASQIFRIQRNGTGHQRLTSPADSALPEAACTQFATISGDGSRISFACRGGEPWGGPNPDLSRETFTATASGTLHRQVSQTLDGDSLEPDSTGDGTQLVFVADTNPTGAPGYWLDEIYRSGADGSGVVRLTAFADAATPPGAPTISDDGRVVAFERAPFVYSVLGDGSSLRQLVEGWQPDLGADGAVIVFVSSSNPLGETGITGRPVYRIAPDGTGLARVSTKTGTARYPRIDATGTWVVYQTREGSAYQVHRQRLDGSGDQVVGPAGYLDDPNFGGRTDVSSGGGLVVFDSAANPTGQNADGNTEVFLWDGSNGTTRQLTVTATGGNRYPRIGRDGTWVYFWSNSQLLGEAWPDEQPYRVHVATGTVGRVGGLSACVALARDGRVSPIAIDAAGTRAFYAAEFGCTPDNPDASGELFVTDYTVPPRIGISPGPAPTTLTWDVEPGIDTYDVIRGDVASLGFNGDASVDLGDVACVENDSYDNSTVGSPDLDTPLPGQVFFYLHRGNAGSYGTSSGGGERRPGSGGCAD